MKGRIQRLPKGHQKCARRGEDRNYEGKKTQNKEREKRGGGGGGEVKAKK